jgi:hypothetical protein
MTTHETISHLRSRGAQCRRLAASISNQNDRAVAALINLALEFEAKAAAIATQSTAETKIDEVPSV